MTTHPGRRPTSRHSLIAVLAVAASVAFGAGISDSAAAPLRGAGANPAVAHPAPVRPAVAAPPAGFSLSWSDDFNGAAGTGVDQGLWKYDTGPGSTFGTGANETRTHSTS